MTNNACIAAHVPASLECQVCFDSYREPVQLLRCGHIFCRRCVSSKASHCTICHSIIEGFSVPSDTIILAAEQVPVVCSTCGWRGTRKASEMHRCNSRETHSEYTRYVPKTDDEWVRYATSKPTDTVPEALPAPPQFATGIPLNWESKARDT